MAGALLAALPPLLVLAAGLLTKPTLVFLVPASAAYLLAARALRQGRPRRAFFAAAACAVLFLALVAAPGWLGGPPVPEGAGGGAAARQLQRLEQVGQGLMEGETLRETARLLFLSSWGVFGWMTLFPPPALIAGYLAVSILVVIGLWRLFRRDRAASAETGVTDGREGAARGRTGDAAGEPGVGNGRDYPARAPQGSVPGVGALFGVACLCLTALVFRNSLFTFQPQGRFLLPLLPLAAPLAAAGLARLGPRRLPGRFLLPVLLFLLGASAYGLLGMILPCYHPADGQALMKFKPSGDSAIIVGQYAEGFSVEEHRRQATRARLFDTGALRLVSTSAGPRDVSLRLAVEVERGPWLLEVWDREKRLAGFPSGEAQREPGGPAGEKTGSGETPFDRAAFAAPSAGRAPATEEKQSPAPPAGGGSRHRILLKGVRLEPGENVFFFHIVGGRPNKGLLFTSLSLVSASPEGQAASGDGDHERG